MPADIRARFGVRLRSLRKRRGLTQVELADYLGLRRTYVSDLERGKRNVSLLTLEIIARTLFSADVSGQIERVRRFMIASEPFTTSNGQMTPTLKIRRHAIRRAHRDAGPPDRGGGEEQAEPGHHERHTGPAALEQQ